MKRTLPNHCRGCNQLGIGPLESGLCGRCYVKHLIDRGFARGWLFGALSAGLLGIAAAAARYGWFA